MLKRSRFQRRRHRSQVVPVGVAEAVTYRDSLGNRVSQGGRVDRASLEVRAELGEREEQVLVAAEAAAEAATVEPVARETAAVTAAMVVMAAMEAVTGLDSDLEAASAVSLMIG